MKALEYFNDNFRGLDHGNSSYIEHCNKIYDILKQLNCEEYVCLAGLYHSVYGTESYQLPMAASRHKIKELIGDKAERLVSIFCSLRDRSNAIANNTLSFDDKTHLDLMHIEYANLLEQSQRLDDSALISSCQVLLNEIYIKQNLTLTHEYKSINDRKVYVFDNLLDNSIIEWINNYCLNSVYKPEHRSNGLNYDLDSRFSCNLEASDIENTMLIPAYMEICKRTNLKLDINNAYINHYGIGTSTSKHCDNSHENVYTILVFCNKYWESTWGGEITFYDDQSNIHHLIEFKPGRIIVFDGRISHKVLPLTISAKKDRYTIAIKCTNRG